MLYVLHHCAGLVISKAFNNRFPNEERLASAYTSLDDYAHLLYYN